MKRLKRKLAVALPILFILFASLATVKADWTLEEQTGEWDICQVTHTAFAGWADGNVTWQTTNSSFQGFTIKLNITEWDTWREWWQYGTIQDYYVHVIISNGTQSVGAVLKIHGWTGLFGAVKGVAYYANAKLTNSIAELDKDLDYAWIYTAAEIKRASIVIYPNGDVLFVVVDRNQTYGGTYFGLGFDFTGQSVTVTLNYYHGGQGSFEIYNTILWTPEAPPGYTPYPEGKAWWEAVWESIQGFFAGIADWCSYIYGGLAFFWSLIVVPIVTNIPTLLAVLPIIVIFWFLDAIVTSIQKGDLQPIGNAVMTVIDFLRGLIQTIVNIAQTIWNIIKFW